VLLSGVLAEPATAELAARIRAALVNGRYEDLGQIAGELVGCLVTSKKIYLFKTIMGNSSTIFFRRSGHAVRWSTSPADLVEDPDTDIDRAAIARCCRGEGLFIYPSIDRVRPGQVVILEQHRTTVLEYDRITPIALPRRTRMRWVWAAAMPVLWALGWTATTLGGIAVEEQFTIFGAYGAVTFSALSGLLLHRLLPPRRSPEHTGHDRAPHEPSGATT